jgi:predicted transcriptional regulator
MIKTTITVGGDYQKDITRRFVAAWRRAEKGDLRAERHLGFESPIALARVLSAKRLELLGHVRRNATKSVHPLAKALGRDYSNVHADVKALAEIDLLEVGKGYVRTACDGIDVRIRY